MTGGNMLVEQVSARGSSLTQSARNRFFLNVGSNICYMVLNTLLLLWYVPFLIRHIGWAAYGMVPLANTLIMYATVLTTSLDVSVNRFLAIDLNQGNVHSANRTFNTALILAATACLVLALPAGAVVYLFPILFNVPAGLESATRFLFASVAATMGAALLSSSFGVTSVITHRFELRNVVRTLTSASRVGVVALCFSFWPASLSFVALGFLISAAIGLAGDVLVWRYLAPELRVRPRWADRQQMRAMAGLGGWSAVNQIGSLLLMQVDLLVVNALFGADATGRYGSILVLVALVYTMTETVVAVLSPMIMAHYATADVDALRRVTLQSVRLLGIALALPVGLLCGFAHPVLSIWLGGSFGDLGILLILLAGHLPVTLAVRPILYGITAYNRVKLQSIITLVLGIATVPAAVLLASFVGWGLAGVASATALVWMVKNVVFLTPYGAAVLGLRLGALYRSLASTAALTAGVGLVSAYLWQVCRPADWSGLFALGAVVGLAYVSGIYALVLSSADRELLWSSLRRRSPA